MSLTRFDRDIAARTCTWAFEETLLNYSMGSDSQSVVSVFTLYTVSQTLL